MRTLAVALALCALGATAHAEVPEHLTRAMIQKAIDGVKPKTKTCAAPAREGVVKLAVKVAPDGTSTVTIKATFDEALGVCLKRVVQKARYEVTQKGGSFTYPFTFSISQE